MLNSTSGTVARDSALRRATARATRSGSTIVTPPLAPAGWLMAANLVHGSRNAASSLSAFPGRDELVGVHRREVGRAAPAAGAPPSSPAGPRTARPRRRRSRRPRSGRAARGSARKAGSMPSAGDDQLEGTVGLHARSLKRAARRPRAAARPRTRARRPESPAAVLTPASRARSAGLLERVGDRAQRDALEHRGRVHLARGRGDQHACPRRRGRARRRTPAGTRPARTRPRGRCAWRTSRRASPRRCPAASCAASAPAAARAPRRAALDPLAIGARLERGEPSTGSHSGTTGSAVITCSATR